MLTVAHRFSEPVRAVVASAVQHASELGHEHLGTEHLLVGVLGEQDSIASSILRGWGVQQMSLTAEIRGLLGVSGPVDPEAVSLTPRAETLLSQPSDPSQGERSERVDVETLLFRLAEGGTSASILVRLGASPLEIRAELRHMWAEGDRSGDTKRGLRSLWTLDVL